MPRLHPRRRMLAWLSLGLGCAALGPGALHEALAAAAGTLFEAAPFVLVAELLPRRIRFLAQLAGCGCRGTLPGALSLPATALCWITFGPAAALGRMALGLAWLWLSRRHARVYRPSEIAVDESARGARAKQQSHAQTAPQATEAPDALENLLVLAPCAGFATLGAGALGALPSPLAATPLETPVAFTLGLALGIVAPCATAGVAIAAALAPHLPAAAAGILVISGVGSLPRRRHFAASETRESQTHAADPAPVERITRIEMSRSVVIRAALACALILLYQRGAAGFVNPRLLPLIALAAPLALLTAARAALARHRTRKEPMRLRAASAALVPAIMLSALALGSPVPRPVAAATQLADAYPGERLSFSGAMHLSAGASVLERYEITCCRADASPVSVRLTLALPAPSGTWVTATGLLEATDRGLALRPERWQTGAPPHDPFLYR